MEINTNFRQGSSMENRAEQEWKHNLRSSGKPKLKINSDMESQVLKSQGSIDKEKATRPSSKIYSDKAVPMVAFKSTKCKNLKDKELFRYKGNYSDIAHILV